MAGSAIQAGADRLEGQGGQGQIQGTNEDADKLYEERMEDEYAKREGGA